MYPDTSPGLARVRLTHLHLRVHVSVDGRQPVDGGQAAASPRASVEHPFLVLIEGSQMRVMSGRLQLVSASTHATVTAAPAPALPLAPCPHPRGYSTWGQRPDKPKSPPF